MVRSGIRDGEANGVQKYCGCKVERYLDFPYCPAPICANLGNCSFHAKLQFPSKIKTLNGEFGFMQMLRLAALSLLCVLALFARTSMCLAAPEGSRRLALIIGNDNYSNIRKLQNARNDAKAIAARLRTFGFQVTEKLDATREEMNDAVSDFKTSVKGGDEALFFYAGHGVQISGGNYLLPTDIKEPRNQDAIKYDSLQLQRVLDELAEREARFSLIIVDACRNYPF
jgi:hypothetical protein